MTFYIRLKLIITKLIKGEIDDRVQGEYKIVTDKTKTVIEKVLKEDDRLWNEEKTELNQTLLLDLIDKIDSKVIDLIFARKKAQRKVFC